MKRRILLQSRCKSSQQHCKFIFGGRYLLEIISTLGLLHSGILLSGFLWEISVERSRNYKNLGGQTQHSQHMVCMPSIITPVFMAFFSFNNVSSSLTGLVCSCARRGLKQLLSINVTLEKHYSEQPFVDFRCGPGKAEDFIICAPGDVSYRRP